MTTTIAPTDIVVSVEPLFSEGERTALAGFLAGYSGLTRDAYALDVRMFTAWCQQHGLHLFQARRADIECFGRDMESRGQARATIARRLCTVAKFTATPYQGRAKIRLRLFSHSWSSSGPHPMTLLMRRYGSRKARRAKSTVLFNIGI
jgi:hypothetical protein